MELPIGSLIGSLTSSTFMLWVNSQPGGSWVRAFDFGTNDPNIYMCLGPRWWFMDDMYFAITTTGADNQSVVQPTGFDLPTGWHHVAVTIDAVNRTIILYYDGEELARTTQCHTDAQGSGQYHQQLARQVARSPTMRTIWVLWMISASTTMHCRRPRSRRLCWVTHDLPGILGRRTARQWM